jgi:hypothetical protein
LFPGRLREWLNILESTLGRIEAAQREGDDPS